MLLVIRINKNVGDNYTVLFHLQEQINSAWLTPRAVKFFERQMIARQVTQLIRRAKESGVLVEDYMETTKITTNSIIGIQDMLMTLEYEGVTL